MNFEIGMRVFVLLVSFKRVCAGDRYDLLDEKTYEVMHTVEVKQSLGGGAFGEVLHVIQVGGTEDEFALKLSRVGNVRDVVNSIKNEAFTVDHLRTPYDNLSVGDKTTIGLQQIKFLGVVIRDGKKYQALLMELLDETVESRIKKINAFPETTSVELWKKMIELYKLAEQMMALLDFIHLNEVIHGDLKTDNAMLKLKDGQYIMFLTDFGSAVKPSTILNIRLPGAYEYMSINAETNMGSLSAARFGDDNASYAFLWAEVIMMSVLPWKPYCLEIYLKWKLLCRKFAEVNAVKETKTENLLSHIHMYYTGTDHKPAKKNANDNTAVVLGDYTNSTENQSSPGQIDTAGYEKLRISEDFPPQPEKYNAGTTSGYEKLCLSKDLPTEIGNSSKDETPNDKTFQGKKFLTIEQEESILEEEIKVLHGCVVKDKKTFPTKMMENVMKDERMDFLKILQVILTEPEKGKKEYIRLLTAARNNLELKITEYDKLHGSTATQMQK